MGYGADLAWVHHEGFGDLARQAAPVVLSELARAGLDGGLVVDLGCGSGILAAELTAAGYDVLGIDRSPDMIRLATRHARKARFEQGSLLDADLPPCVAVTALGESCNYSLDMQVTPPRLGRLFKRVHRALTPGGVFVLDVAGPGRAGRTRVQRRFHDGGHWALRVEAVENPAGTLLTRDITLFRQVGKLYRRSDERHVLRLHPPDEVAAALERAGFAVRRLRAYGDYRFPKGLAGFVATKAGR